MKKKLLTIALVFILGGCNNFKTSEEKLILVCIDSLEVVLKKYAKWSGWSIEHTEGRLYSMEPDTESTNTDRFHKFEIGLSNFSTKNGFGASKQDSALCKGIVSKDNEGEYEYFLTNIRPKIHWADTVFTVFKDNAFANLE